MAPCLLNSLQCISGVDTWPGSIFCSTPRPFSSRNTVTMETNTVMFRGEVDNIDSLDKGSSNIAAPDPTKPRISNN